MEKDKESRSLPEGHLGFYPDNMHENRMHKALAAHGSNFSAYTKQNSTPHSEKVQESHGTSQTQVAIDNITLFPPLGSKHFSKAHIVEPDLPNDMAAKSPQISTSPHLHPQNEKKQDGSATKQQEKKEPKVLGANREEEKKEEYGKGQPNAWKEATNYEVCSYH